MTNTPATTEKLPPDLQSNLAAGERIIWYGKSDQSLVLQRTMRYWLNVVIVLGVLTWYVHDAKGVWWWSTYTTANVMWAVFMLILAIVGTTLRHRMSSRFSLLLTDKQLIIRQPVLFSINKFKLSKWPASAVEEAVKLWSKRLILRLKDPNTQKTIRWTTEPMADADQAVAAINSAAQKS